MVVEFSDFQCPACAKHTLEVQPVIDTALVDTGKVRWVAKSLPLKEHPYAALAAVAAECAGAQGRYWPMHRRLFERLDEWTNDNAADALVRIAVEQGLDRASFQACFDGRAALERVLGDLYDAQGFLERTPSFVILTGGPTGSITGPLPADKFIKLLETPVAAP